MQHKGVSNIYERASQALKLSVAIALLNCYPIASIAAEALELVQTIPLTGVEGRIDHLGFDGAGKRLFVAAFGNNTVEVIDLAAAKVSHQINGLAAPQGVAFAPDVNRLAVASDKDGSLRIYDGTSFKCLATADLKDDADNVRYDPGAHCLWVGYGEGGLAAIDAQSGKIIADIKLDAHPESFQLELKGPRIFVNVPSAGHVAVVDREKSAVVAAWPLKDASAIFPMALDEPNHRLFVGCRTPPRLLVLNSDTGQTVASVAVVGDTDDVFYDAAKKRIYVSGGEGAVTVVSQSDSDDYAVLENVPTAAGARTSYFAGSFGILYVAVPHRGGHRAELRAFKTQ